eukprot:tig00000900_g5367.t1
MASVYTLLGHAEPRSRPVALLDPFVQRSSCQFIGSGRYVSSGRKLGAEGPAPPHPHPHPPALLAKTTPPAIPPPLRRAGDRTIGAVAAPEPDDAEWHGLMATALTKSDTPAAVRHAERALQLDPAVVPAITLLAWARGEEHRYGEAARHYQDAHERLRTQAAQPGGSSESNRRAAERERGALLGNWARTLAMTASWRRLPAVAADLRREVERDLAPPLHPQPITQPLFLLALPVPEALLSAFTARFLRAQVAAVTDGAWPPPPPAYPPHAWPAGRRLRVGYVSADFGTHAAGRCVARLFALHDRSRVEVFAYSLNPPLRPDDRFHEAVRSSAEHWVEARAPFVAFRGTGGLDSKRDRLAVEIAFLHGPEYAGDDRAAAARINADGIDVLLNANGHTVGARDGIFALRPAPIQLLSFTGYHGYYGAASPEDADPFMGGIVTDRLSRTPELAANEAVYGGERVAYLPPPLSMLPYTPVDMHALPPPPTSAGDAAAAVQAPAGPRPGRFTFCNFGKYYKLDAEVFGVWANVLRRVPGSVFWMLRYPKDGAGDAEGALEAEAAAAGLLDVSLREGAPRVVFSDLFSDAEHIARKAACGLYLDSQRYNSHTTVAEAAWGGVPVVTMPAERMEDGAGSDLAPPIVPSLKAYEDAAVALAAGAGAPGRLAALRAALAAAREARRGYFDNAAFARGVEAALELLAEARAAEWPGARGRPLHHVAPAAPRAASGFGSAA